MKDSSSDNVKYLPEISTVIVIINLVIVIINLALNYRINNHSHGIENDIKHNKIELKIEDSFYELLNKFINAEVELMHTYENRMGKIEEKYSDSIGLLDIIREKYKGINIAISLINSPNPLTGEVLNSTKEVLVVKSNGIVYFIDKDKIVYFY
ncbi:MAG: hypothetical protein ACM3X7_14160 [Solirubrobacterales bacterium]